MAHLENVSKNGESTSFFHKVALDEQGRRMMHEEYGSMTALCKVVPDFVPKPRALGSYKDIQGMHFFAISCIAQ